MGIGQHATQRYVSAARRMQSGVAAELGQEGDDSNRHKHLRVGVNTAHSDQAGLVKLLIAKGVITEAEYGEAIADEMEAEVGRYEALLSEKLGTKVTLGECGL